MAIDGQVCFHSWLFVDPVNCILLAQLIATLIHYPCTVALPGLVGWSAFLELVLSTMLNHDLYNRAYGGH